MNQLEYRQIRNYLVEILDDKFIIGKLNNYDPEKPSELFSIIKDHFEVICSFKVFGRMIDAHKELFNSYCIYHNEFNSEVKSYILVDSGPIVISGNHKVICNGRSIVISLGGCHITASHYSKVIAMGDTNVTAYDFCSLVLRDTSRALVNGHTDIICYDRTSVFASDLVTVMVGGGSPIISARDSSKITSRHGGRIFCYDNSHIYSYDQSDVKNFGKHTILELHDSTLCELHSTPGGLFADGEVIVSLVSDNISTGDFELTDYAHILK